MGSLKNEKFGMDSPVQKVSPKGGIVSNPKTKSLGKVSGGKGTKSHFAMDSPDKAGGGWTTGK